MPLPAALILLGVAGFLLFRSRQWQSEKQDSIKGGKNSLRLAKYLFGLGFAIILLASNLMIARLVIAPLEHLHPPYKGQPVAAVLVLGSYHRSAPELPVTSIIENDSLYRLAEGIRIARQHPEAKLIVSGYAFKDPISQAEAYRQTAVALGFPDERILLLDTGRDTYEEMQGVKKMIGEREFALVTAAYHMPRSMAAAQKNGLRPVAAPTWHKVKPSVISPWALVPSTKALRLTTLALYEYLGILWYKMTGRL